MATQFGIVLVTVPNRSEAESMAKFLVEAKLAACVSLMPIHSIYPWQGDLCSEEEWQLIIKTDLTQFDQLATKVQAIHPYEVPELIALPIVAGSSGYLNWMAEQVTPD
ncbi:MAG: divalent-cation tolerance protein CutA [Oscillatoriales cyanobacterium RM2_1_1]|nr:divalent-cation tolerance protein CutA [Oscillatoriales cyanobacterium SM2_3_0]NJO46193.1 divalent-cation tolerance protein CutA [Oscillatoriales cyanobacterium RM2_1_1]